MHPQWYNAHVLYMLLSTDLDMKVLLEEMIPHLLCANEGHSTEQNSQYQYKTIKPKGRNKLI